MDICTIELNHPGNSYGYSVVSEQKKFCYLLDNEYESNQKKELIEFCNFSDTIIWDGMFLDKELPFIFGKPSIDEFIKFTNIIDQSKLSFNQVKNLYFFPSKNIALPLTEAMCVLSSKCV